MTITKKDLLKVSNFVGECFTFAYSALLIAVFYLAFFDPTQRVTIFINNFGESTIEFIIVTASIPFVSIAIIYSVARVRKEFEEYRESKFSLKHAVISLGKLNNRIYLLGITMIIASVVLYVFNLQKEIAIILLLVFGILEIKLTVEKNEIRS